MRVLSFVGLLLSLILVGPATAADTRPAATADSRNASKRTTSRDGWPDTRAGELARAWVEAFSSGEAAMREFNLKSLSQESQAQKGADQRIATYRKNRERFGKLVFASVVKSTPGELTVELMDADAAPHEFTFAVQTTPPYKLVSVSRRERRHSGHFGFHH